MDGKNKLKYTVKFMMENINNGTEIEFCYNNTKYFIGFSYDNTPKGIIAYVIKKKQNKLKGKYGVCKVGKENEVQNFCTPKELFENAVIEEKKLKDVWDNIEITWIAGFDKY